MRAAAPRLAESLDGGSSSVVLLIINNTIYISIINTMIINTSAICRPQAQVLVSAEHGLLHRLDIRALLLVLLQCSSGPFWQVLQPIADVVDPSGTNQGGI